MRSTSPLWHPCTQMKDHEALPPLKVKSAHGLCLELEDGRFIYDVVSSWWCKNLGHGDPRLRAALKRQADVLEHCMLANATHEAIECLSERLTERMPGLNKVAYASDGACAVEMAMKMSVHAHQLKGEIKRTRFVALSGAYHGETCGALGVSDLGLYKAPYANLTTSATFIRSIPYVVTRHDALWQDATLYWESIKQQLEPIAAHVSAVLIEPILQAANHMQLYSVDLLKKLRQWCDEQGIHLIADEIMTGFGRTGTFFACEQAHIVPDFLCIGKTMTAGWLPMSAVLTRDTIYDLFYQDYTLGKSFLHSHTYAGNPLAARVALAHLQIIDEENLLARVRRLESQLLDIMREIVRDTGKLQHVRGIGSVVAADLVNPQQRPRFGQEVLQKALQQGLLLRPLGDTIYWVLPINIDDETLGTIRTMMKRLFDLV